MRENRGRRGSVPDHIKSIIYDLYYKANKKDKEIVQILKDEHGIDLAKGSLYKMLATEKAKRTLASQKVLEEDIRLDAKELFTYLTGDIRNFHKFYEEKLELIDDDEIDLKTLIKLKEVELKMIEIVLRSHGMLDESKTVSEAIDRLNAKLGL